MVLLSLRFGSNDSLTACNAKLNLNKRVKEMVQTKHSSTAEKKTKSIISSDCI